MLKVSKIKQKACLGKAKVRVFHWLQQLQRGLGRCFCSRHESCYAFEHDISNPLSFGCILPRGLLESLYPCGG